MRDMLHHAIERQELCDDALRFVILRVAAFWFSSIVLSFHVVPPYARYVVMLR